MRDIIIAATLYIMCIVLLTLLAFGLSYAAYWTYDFFAPRYVPAHREGGGA